MMRLFLVQQQYVRRRCSCPSFTGAHAFNTFPQRHNTVPCPAMFTIPTLPSSAKTDFQIRVEIH